MSTTYTDLIRTNFPDSLDTFNDYSDITSAMLPFVKAYQEYYAAGDLTNAAKILEAHSEIKNCIINADNLNRTLHAVRALERMFNSDIQSYIQNLVTYRGDYTASQKYSKYSVVYYNGLAYMATSLNIPLGTVPTNTEYWIPLSIVGRTGTAGLGLSFNGVWISTETYTKDSAVSYNNSLYASNCDDNKSHTPSTNSSYWTLMFNLDNVLAYDNSISGSTCTTLPDAINELYSKTNANITKLNTIQNGAQVNSITGVKGSSESSYRTGQVNITPANLGITVINNTSDSNKSVKYATSAGSANTCTTATNANYATSAGSATSATNCTNATNASKINGYSIQVSTTDLNAGSSSLSTNTIYLVYE